MLYPVFAFWAVLTLSVMGKFSYFHKKIDLRQLKIRIQIQIIKADLCRRWKRILLGVELSARGSRGKYKERRELSTHALIRGVR